MMMRIATTQDPLAHTAVGGVAATLHGATSVMRELKIDYLSNLDASLFDAAARSGVNLNDATDRLLSLDGNPLDDLPADTDELIELILIEYHAKHRRELPTLYQLAKKVEDMHHDHPDRPLGLADAISILMNDLDSHMVKEESVLFPLLQQGGHPHVIYPIAMMMREHDAHGHALANLEKVTNRFTAPPHACRTWTTLYEGLATLTDDLVRHIYLENKILFPHFASRPAGTVDGCSCSGTERRVR